MTAAKSGGQDIFSQGYKLVQLFLATVCVQLDNLPHRYYALSDLPEEEQGARQPEELQELDSSQETLLHSCCAWLDLLEESETQQQQPAQPVGQPSEKLAEVWRAAAGTSGRTAKRARVDRTAGAADRETHAMGAAELWRD